MIQQVSYLGIVVNDLEASTAYYRDTLGLEIDEAECIPGQYTQFKLNGDVFMSLQAGTEIPGGQSFEPALLVDDADAVYNMWRAKGVEMLSEPHEMPFGRTFLFKTSEGHVLRVAQHHSQN